MFKERQGERERGGHMSNESSRTRKQKQWFKGETGRENCYFFRIEDETPQECQKGHYENLFG